MESEKTTTRIVYLDILKGLAVFLVVWGHTIQNGGKELALFENKMFTFIYAFHMPLFVLMSGYLFAKSMKCRTLFGNLKNKFIHIAIPAVVWGCLFCVVKWMVEKALGNAVELSISVCIQEIGKIWFVWTVLLCMAVVMMAKKIGKDKFFVPVLICGIAILYFLPYREYTLYLFPYFIGGYYIENHSSNKLKKGFWTALLLFPLMLQNFQSKHFIYVSGIDIFHSEYGWSQQIQIDLFRWGIGFAGCITACIAVKLFNENVPGSRVGRMLSAVGKYSLEIYLMQRILVEYLGNKFMWKLVHCEPLRFLVNEGIYNYVFTPLCSMIFTAVLYYSAKALRTMGKQIRRKLFD